MKVIKSRILGRADHVAMMEEGRSTFRIVTNKPTGKRPLGKPRHGCEDNIGMDLQEIGINAKNRIALIQNRDYWRDLENVALTFRFHKQ